MSDTAKPSDIILKFLEEIVESWKKKAYAKAAEQCTALLKRKKTIDTLGLTTSLQRILLQAYLHQEKYDKVLEWDKAAESKRGCEDLVLYAKYRTGDYATVSKEASEAGKAAAERRVVFQNLRAQSEYHLDRTEKGLAVYLELVSGDDIDDNDVESKMEILTNALGLIASSGCTPTVALDDENTTFWLEEAESTLLQDDGNEAVDEIFSELASNLGCIRFLTDPTQAGDENWLEKAADTGGDEDAKKGTTEQTNLSWSKHFWYKNMEEVSYHLPSKSSGNQLSVVESVSKVNEALLEENLTRLLPLPHPKWNLLQLRLYWYNRAILQLKAEKYVECHDSCQSLKKTLSSPSGSNKKKNKNAATPTTKPSSESLWWDARADVILAYAQQGQSKHKDASSRLTDRLETLRGEASSSFEVDHAIAHVLLHKFTMEQKSNSKKDQQKGKRELLKVLQSLPQSIQSRPAVQLTIDDVETAVENDESNSNSATNTTPKNPIEKADLLFGQGQYEEACKLYESALSSNSASQDVDSIMDSNLRYVQALAMTGQHETSQELWQSLQSTLREETVGHPDGSALENKALPRTSRSSSTISKKLAVTKIATKDDEVDKPSREKILRRRARKREAYLQELERQGKYNPDRPTKPDPERWIPWYERSRYGRNRGGRNNNKGLNSAQGGGSQLDAQRLDAAARRAGKVPASTGPSSANLKVSSGGRKGGRRR